VEIWTLNDFASALILHTYRLGLSSKPADRIDCSPISLDQKSLSVVMSATSGYDENELLLNLLGPGDYDNFNEPTPWANKKSSLMGLTITFMVRSPLLAWFWYAESRH
jgi:hypothetical protein